jgi:hypothetical protein
MTTPPRQTRIFKSKTQTRREPAPVDLRTPSGQLLPLLSPYQNATASAGASRTGASTTRRPLSDIGLTRQRTSCADR